MYRQSCVTDVDHSAERWFAAVPNAEDGARIFVRRTLERWNLSMLAHTAKLIVAELVRRSLAQTSADYAGLLSVRLARSDVLYMAVWDPYETLPATEADGEHGFKVVEGLCDRWGYQPLSGGKLVWCELACAAVADDVVDRRDFNVLLQRVVNGLRRLN